MDNGSIKIIFHFYIPNTLYKASFSVIIKLLIFCQKQVLDNNVLKRIYFRQ